MKIIIFIFFLILNLGLKAQIILTSGQYTTADGYYTLTINFDNNNLTLIEPNKTSVYTRLKDNEFKFVNPTNGIEYRIEVINTSTIHTYKPTTASYRSEIKLSNASIGADNKQFNTYFAIAEKYKAKMKTDAKDAQLWSFCAAAAMARSTMNTEGFKDYASKITASIKQIIINQNSCPCEDVIPPDIWNGK